MSVHECYTLFNVYINVNIEVLPVYRVSDLQAFIPSQQPKIIGTLCKCEEHRNNW